MSGRVGERAFQVEGTARTKAMRWESSHQIPGTKRRGCRSWRAMRRTGWGFGSLRLILKTTGGSNEGLRRVLMGRSAAGPSTAAAFLRSGLRVGSRVKAGRPVGRPLQLSKQERNKWF